MIAHCWQGTALQQLKEDQMVTSRNSLLHTHVTGEEIISSKSICPSVCPLLYQLCHFLAESCP